MNDYIALGAIIVLRFALAFEVHWEMKNKVWHLERSIKVKEASGEK